MLCWVSICGKTGNNSINKIHKSTLWLIYEMEDAPFEDFENCTRENNIEIYKVYALYYPANYKEFFRSKREAV